MATYLPFPGLPDSPPSHARFFKKKQQFEQKFQELLLELLFFRKMLCDFVSIVIFLKTCSRKSETDKYQKHIVGDLTRPRPRPGELFVFLGGGEPIPPH